MTTIFYEKDACPEKLKEKKIAIIGFGSQGQAHALNLRDSGFSVLVGLRRDSPRRPAVVRAGLPVADVAEAVAQAELVALLIPDEKQPALFQQEMAAQLSQGKTLLFAHGFAIHFGQIVPPVGVDVVLVAPKGPGNLVRREYESGRGVPSLLAVHQDESGSARETALAYAYGIGATRAGVIATTFRAETETDLFGEQAVLCGGLTSLMKAGFETLVAAGYAPELAYFECIHEMKLIVDLIYEGGFAAMRRIISNTAEYGDYITQDRLFTGDNRRIMEKILADIQSGRFAREWVVENQSGLPFFNTMRRREAEQQLEEVGRRLRGMMPWLSHEEKANAQ